MGYLYFVARKDDIIKTGGQKVSPKEVENAIYALPGILEAAVVGVPDAVLGMAIKAVVVGGAGSPSQAAGCSYAIAPSNLKTSWCRRSSNSATACRRRNLERSGGGRLQPKFRGRKNDRASCESHRPPVATTAAPTLRSATRRHLALIGCGSTLPQRRGASPRRFANTFFAGCAGAALLSGCPEVSTAA